MKFRLRLTPLMPLLLLAGVAWSATMEAAALDRPDAWITLKAKLALMMADDVDGTAINVDTVNNEVSLFGTVASEPSRQKALHIVREIEGVTNVRDMLTVDPDMDDEDENMHHGVDDDVVEERVEELLDRHDGEGFDVEVESVDDGVVVLDGEVDTFPRQVDIIEQVRRIPGVRRVDSRIEAPDEMVEPDHWFGRNYDPSVPATAPVPVDERASEANEDDGRDPFEDVWITTMVKGKLLANRDVPALEINVDTWDAEVTLFGTVDSEAAKRTAEAEALSVDDVREVRNELQVVAESSEEVVDEQDDAIEDRAEASLDERSDLDGVEVQVENGVARLTGEVDSMFARLSAATLVRSLSGVKSVINDVRVERQVEE